MGVYQCEACGCIENTATGRYHTRKWDSIWDKNDPTFGKAVCCVCQPTHYVSGEPNNKYTGKWHDRFDRTYYPKGSLIVMNHELIHEKSGKPYYETDLGREEEYE